MDSPAQTVRLFRRSLSFAHLEVRGVRGYFSFDMPLWLVVQIAGFVVNNWGAKRASRSRSARSRTSAADRLPYTEQIEYTE